jgi:CBS domain-containing protein
LGEHLDALGVAAPEIVDAATDVDDAIRRMHDKGIDCVLVVDGGRLVGIFTDRDAVLKVAGTNPEDHRIGALMTHDPVVLRHDETIAVAINKMAVGGFRHIPIVEDGRPTGVVSARDVFRHLAQSLG